MPELFSADWAKKYQEAWNSSDGIADQLGQTGFSSVVGFGIDGEDAPRVVLKIEKGVVVSAGKPNGDECKWDLRASPQEWASMVSKPPGLMKLGLAYTSRKLKFNKGDYAVMIKDPGLSSAFVKCFALMSKAMV